MLARAFFGRRGSWTVGVGWSPSPWRCWASFGRPQGLRRLRRGLVVWPSAFFCLRRGLCEQMDGVAALVVVGLVAVVVVGLSLPGLFSSVAVGSDFEDDGVVDEAVDGGDGHGAIGEDFVPA